MIDGTMSEEANDGSSKRAPDEDECAATDASSNVSHASLTQLTPPAAPGTDGGKWICDVCTYENFPMSRKCTMCRNSKPALNEDIFRLQDGASALPALPATPNLPSPDAAGAEAVTERLKPLRISSPQGAAAASGSKWSCMTCTYDNWPKSLKCAMCGSNNPTHASHPVLGINDICNSQPASIHELESARRSKRRNNTDWIWLQACLGVVEGSARCVETYLASGGDPARALTAREVALLDRASAFDAGHTLVHLAIRFQRQDILSTLLSRISGGGPGLKRSPSYIAPDLASAIRRHIASCVRYKKGSFPSRYINEFSTFYLPDEEISLLPAPIQEQLYSELLDQEAQRSLALDGALGGAGPLYALWNRSAGDCLPDAVCQAAYGVFDRHNTLRGCLAELLGAGRALFPRWAAWERAVAQRLHYAPSDVQLRGEWARLGAAAARPGAALGALHVWALAHVLRRPLLVYGDELHRSFRGEALDYARLRGVYLPLLCERAACSPAPLALAYTRGHFSALVGGAREAPLPLAALPVPFLLEDEAPDEVLRRWLGPGAAGPAPAVRPARPPRPLLQAQLLEEWLNHYRRLAQATQGPFPPRLGADFSSDADTDEE